MLTESEIHEIEVQERPDVLTSEEVKELQMSCMIGTRRTSRQVWVAVHGPLPREIYVLHLCDQPLCSNLEHLYTGTQFDNLGNGRAGPRIAATKKGRHPSNYGKPMTDDQKNKLSAAVRNRSRDYHGRYMKEDN